MSPKKNNTGAGIDYDQLADDYQRHRKVHPEVIRELVRMGFLNAGSRVLDVGCGTGNYLKALARTTRCACWGVEPSAEMLAMAGKQNPKAELSRGRAESMEYPGCFFDLVFSVDVIHHCSDIARFFRIARRVLDYGGRVCTVTDTEETIPLREPLSRYFPETVPMELRRYPSAQQVQCMMAAAGFSELMTLQVAYPYKLTDMQAYRDKAFSALHLIPGPVFDRGISKMAGDLKRGPIQCVSRYQMIWGKK